MDNFFNTEAWRRERLGKFTASEIHRLLSGGKRKMTEDELKAEKEAKGRRSTVETLFGDGAITYIEEKIAEIITGDLPIDDFSTMKALEWGAAHEHEAVAMLQEHHGVDIEYFGISDPKFFKYNAFSGGSPDGLDKRNVYEVKCPYKSSNHVTYLRAPKKASAATPWLKENKPDYYAQVQFNMICCDKERGWFVSFDPRALEPAHRLAVLWIEADKEFQDNIKLRISEAGNIISGALAALYNKQNTLLITPVHGAMLVEKG